MAIHTNPASLIVESLSSPQTNRADEAPSGAEARRAGPPSPRRFPDARSYGKSAHIILLGGVGHHQPNLTGRVPSAREPFQRVYPDLKRHVLWDEGFNLRRRDEILSDIDGPRWRAADQ